MDLFVQRYKRNKIADNVDWISKLSDDVLLLILSRLSTKEAIRTSVVSKRWEHVWKQMPHLVLNTRRRSKTLRRCDDLNPDAELTRIINNHYGHLESCEIIHSTNKKGVHGLLKRWIQTIETRNLTLVNMHYRLLCSFPLCFFAHPKLTSLSLNSYYLASSRPFRNCSNIKILKLLYIYSSNVEVFNNILAFCPSLEVLVLNIRCTDTRGRSFTLKIENSKLKFLDMYSVYDFDKVIVSAPSLDILVAENTISEECEFLLQSPNLQFNENSMVRQCIWLRIFYNISKEENNGHQDLVNRIGELTGEKYPTLSVAVDLMNETEVERLRQFLCLWSNTVYHFEIKFKGNNAPSRSEEIEFWQKKLWVENDHKDSFSNAKFRVNVVLIYNFKGSKEEIAFVSCLIRQRKVRRRILINSNSFSASNRPNIEAAVAKLHEVKSEDQQRVTIKYFRD